jgi:hypothetical protein
MSVTNEGWAPQACTLPAVDRPLRLAEFDDLFATVLVGQERVSPTRLRWRLDASVESIVRNLTERESSCCSFFTFTLTPHSDALNIDVDVPLEQVLVLDALSDRAAAGMSA